MVPSLVLLCAVAVVAHLWTERQAQSVLHGASKIIASLCFVGVAITSGALETLPGQLILAGLVLSALGDALLLSDKRLLFLGGMGAFGLAHLAYAAGFWAAGPAELHDWGRALFLTSAFTGLTLRYLWPRLLPAWRAPVLAYSVIIALMVASALAGTMAGVLAVSYLIAAIAFAVSDISVARDRLTAKDPRSRVWGLPLYYASQMMFAVSV